MEYCIKRLKKSLDICFESINEHLDSIYEDAFDNLDEDTKFDIDCINYWFYEYDDLIKELIKAYENNDNN